MVPGPSQGGWLEDVSQSQKEAVPGLMASTLFPVNEENNLNLKI